jgi:exo-1,4-beta-D-glucosaminidase
MSNVHILNNTSIAPWGGKGVAIYGGSGHLVQNNYVSDTARYIDLGVGKFGVNGSDLTSGTVTGNVVVRAGGNGYSQQQAGMHIGNGGDGQSVGTVANVTVSGNTIRDSLYNSVDFSTSTGITFEKNTVDTPGLNGDRHRAGVLPRTDGLGDPHGQRRDRTGHGKVGVHQHVRRIHGDAQRKQLVASVAPESDSVRPMIRVKVASICFSSLALASVFALSPLAGCGSSASRDTGGGMAADSAAADSVAQGAETGSGYDGSSGAGDAAGQSLPVDASHIPLTSWSIQSSAVATDPGTTISTAAYSTNGWSAATVPSTVLGALVADGVYNDVMTGMNLRSVPGTTYPIGTDYLSIPVTGGSPFAPGWWFRTEFATPSAAAVTLHFEGISYRADLFLNGRSIATSSEVLGTFRRWDFDVTKYLVQGGSNTLAVLVTAQEPNHLGLDFLDWNPAPADRLMGLIRDVYLVQHAGVEIRDPFVATHLNGGAAALTVGADLHNGSPAPVQGTLRGTIDSTIAFQKDITLNPGDTTSVSFDPATFPQLNVASPRLWWPAKLGAQALYTLDLQFVVGGKVSHEQTIPFGIREVTSTLTPDGWRLFSINGKRILVRGGGYTPDMLYRQDPARQLAELQYVLDLNLNAVRLEGKFENENFFYLADQLGILVMPGLMCCDYWQNSANWVAGDFPIASSSVLDQARRLRKHPSVLTFLYGSDVPPVAQAEQGYLSALQQASWPNPMQAGASESPPMPISGPTGYKMRGPYDYVPPIYWYADTAHGGAFGFATEIGPGAAPPPVESLQAMVGAGHMWPIDSVWNYHAGARSPFTDVNYFTNALTKRYGPAGGVDDYATKAQLMAYESHRAMFEAYARNKYASATGVIQWMLNNAWPGMIWHLYDYYLRPGGSYFGAKKGNEYLHVQYSYDDQSIWVVNHYYQDHRGLKATATLFDIHSAQKFTQSAQIDALADTSVKTGIVVPVSAQSSAVSFLDLELTDSAGKPVSSNFYWLTPTPDVMGPTDPSSDWYVTPIATYSDFRALAGQPQVTLTGSASTQQGGAQSTTTVTLHNASPNIAFFTRLQVVGTSGQEVLPVRWDDNYVSIPPGGSKTLAAQYDASAAGGPVTVKVSGFNLAPTQL